MINKSIKVLTLILIAFFSFSDLKAERRILDITKHIDNYSMFEIPDSLLPVLDSATKEMPYQSGIRTIYEIYFGFDKHGVIKKISIIPFININDTSTPRYINFVNIISELLKEHVKNWKFNIKSIYPDGLPLEAKYEGFSITIDYKFLYQNNDVTMQSSRNNISSIIVDGY